MKNNNLVAIDLAKHVFQVCVLNPHNKPSVNKKVKRAKLLETVLQSGAKQVVMEACYSSNHWGRLFEQHGLSVSLIPPYQVKPFVMGNKNDHNDALAIAEAALRPKASRIAVKSLDKQDVQSLFRIRERWMRHRTAASNQLRGLLAEYGIIVPKTISKLRQHVPDILEDADNGLTMVARGFIDDLYQELIQYDNKIQTKQREIQVLLEQQPHFHLLQTIPGFGPIVSGHLLSAVHDIKQFKNGRSLAAWIGLTPKQYASGDKSRMLGISKRGNSVLRKQLIHGARAVINWCQNKDDTLSRWLQNLLAKKPANVAIVALANKLARIAYAVLNTQQPFNQAMCVQDNV